MMGRAWVALAVLAACGGGSESPAPDAGSELATFTLSGTVRYEDRPGLPSGLLGSITPKPVRGADVYAFAETDGATRGQAVTDETGAYSMTYQATAGEPMHVLVIASSSAPGRPITVKRLQPGGAATRVHGFGGATFGAASTTSDVLVTVASGEAGAFNILDTLIEAMDRLPAAFGLATPVPMVALWQVGNADGTYYLDGAHEMRILGESGDDDSFDDTVILHETGHYIEDVIGRSDSPGGDHDGSPTDPRLAWSEGFSTYFALAVRGSRLYIDTNAGTGYVFDADESLTLAVSSAALGQNVSEDLVTEILFDLGDGGAGDDDPLDGTHDPVLAIEAFLRTAILRSAGMNGVDLVDWLDGWFSLEGQGACAAMRAIVNTQHQFPYDYGFAGGPCP